MNRLFRRDFWYGKCWRKYLGLMLFSSSMILLLNMTVFSKSDDFNLVSEIGIEEHDDFLVKRKFVRTIAEKGFKPKNSVIPDSFYEKKPNVTAHNFKYLHNPTHFCDASGIDGINKNINFLFTVASASWEYERRKIIRRTWASVRSIGNSRIGVLFFTGDDENLDTVTRISHEAQRYGDIVQESYKETYRNLSLKTQGQLKWASTYCSNVDFVVHVDDDVFPDVRKIVQEHNNTKNTVNTDISCPKVFKPIVRRDGKWETSIDEYSGTQYPLSCVGWCFVIPYTIVKALYQMSLHTKVLHLEDVWITGILREKIGNCQVRKIPGGEAICKHLGWPKDKPVNKKLKEQWEIYKFNNI